MIWNASEGIADEDEALPLLPRPLELEGSPTASVSMSMGSPSSWLPSSSSPGTRTLILMMVSLLIVEGVDNRLIS